MWNTALSEALYGTIQGLEITLRNKMHERLAARFGPRWYDVASVGLQYIQQDQVLRAKQSLQQQGKPPDSPRIVAELSLGFWVGLFGTAIGWLCGPTASWVTHYSRFVDIYAARPS